MGEEIHVSGTVRGVQNRSEVRGGGPNGQTSSVSILLFRVDPLDGGRPVDVEMRGSRINGTVVDGEVVDVFGKRRRNGTLRAKRIVSRETGATIDTRLPAALVAVAAVVGVALLGWFAFLGVAAFRDHGDAVTPRDPAPSSRFGDDLRQKGLRECLADPHFTDAQCHQVYG